MLYVPPTCPYSSSSRYEYQVRSSSLCNSLATSSLAITRYLPSTTSETQAETASAEHAQWPTSWTAGQSRNRVSIPDNDIYFSPLKTVQSIFGIYPDSYSVGNWAPTLWRETDLSPPASIESKKIPTYIPTHTYVFMPCTVTSLSLHLPKQWKLQIFKRQYMTSGWVIPVVLIGS